MTATCPKCQTDGFANPGELAAHLIDAHDMAGIAALALARSTVPHEDPNPAKEIAMPQPRKTTGTCGYCKGERPKHKAYCRIAHPELAGKPRATKRKAITKNHPKKPARKVGAEAGNGLLGELDALRTTAAALDPLGPVERLHVLACVAKLLAIDTSELAT